MAKSYRRPRKTSILKVLVVGGLTVLVISKWKKITEWYHKTFPKKEEEQKK
jgi:hypothetical protein